LNAVDALQKPNNVFPITVAAIHPIHATGLSAVIESLDTKEEIQLYFVIPAERFESFETQHYFRPKPPRIEPPIDMEPGS
jgi:hypothetical protein